MPPQSVSVSQAADGTMALDITNDTNTQGFEGYVIDVYNLNSSGSWVKELEVNNTVTSSAGYSNPVSLSAPQGVEGSMYKFEVFGDDQCDGESLSEGSATAYLMARKLKKLN